MTAGDLGGVDHERKAQSSAKDSWKCRALRTMLKRLGDKSPKDSLRISTAFDACCRPPFVEKDPAKWSEMMRLVTLQKTSSVFFLCVNVCPLRAVGAGWQGCALHCRRPYHAGPPFNNPIVCLVFATSFTRNGLLLHFDVVLSNLWSEIERVETQSSIQNSMQSDVD